MTQVDLLEQWRLRSERSLASLLPERFADGGQQQLAEAMRYSLLAGGKRLRPVLVYVTCEAVGGCLGSLEDLDRVAAAIECIHTYSLIHDDLPAMDDDDLRRGRPSCHRAFDEATAILAGDALQTLAFGLIAGAGSIPAETRVNMVAVLSSASGVTGMAGGQAVDMFNVGKQPSAAALETMHRLKTGALIRAAVTLGALAGGADDVHTDALGRYADAIGLAFQVQDDILDHSGSTEALGKQTGADAARDKPTYVSLLGLDAAREFAQRLVSDALSALQDLPGSSATLERIARYIISRDR